MQPLMNIDIGVEEIVTAFDRFNPQFDEPFISEPPPPEAPGAPPEPQQERRRDPGAPRSVRARARTQTPISIPRPDERILMPNMQQYSPGRIDAVSPKAARLIKDLFDRINWLTSEVERLGGKPGPQGGGGGGTGMRISNALLPAGTDNLVSPGMIPGGVMGGTENWGYSPLIAVGATDITLPIDQAIVRTLAFVGTPGATRTITLPLIFGKIWIIRNVTNASLTFIPSNGPAVGPTIATLMSAIILREQSVIVRITPDTA